MGRSSQRTWPEFNDEYKDWLREQGAIYGFDGCTVVTELAHCACLEHDYHYRFAADRYGDPVSRAEADKIFRQRLPWWLKYRWLGTRLFAGRAWEKHRNVEKAGKVDPE